MIFKKEPIDKLHENFNFHSNTIKKFRDIQDANQTNNIDKSEYFNALLKINEIEETLQKQIEIAERESYHLEDELEEIQYQIEQNEEYIDDCKSLSSELDSLREFIKTINYESETIYSYSELEAAGQMNFEGYF